MYLCAPTDPAHVFKVWYAFFLLSTCVFNTLLPSAMTLVRVTECPPLQYMLDPLGLHFVSTPRANGRVVRAPQRRRAGEGSFELVARVSTVAHAAQCNEGSHNDVSLTHPSDAQAGPLLTKCARVAVPLSRGCTMASLLRAALAAWLPL